MLRATVAGLQEDSGPTKRKEVVAISYNVHSFGDALNIQEMINALKPYKPDILGLCEVGCL